MASTETEEMPDYERRRFENIKRNREKLAALNLHSLSSSLSAKRPRDEKKVHVSQTRVKSRSSLRAQGIAAPRASGLPDPDKHARPPKVATVSMREACQGDEDSHTSFVEKVSNNRYTTSSANTRVIREEPIDVQSFQLNSEVVAQIVPSYDDVHVIQFFPTVNSTMVVAGSKSGYLGFWDGNSLDDEEDEQTIHLYRPHSATVTGISVHPVSLSQMYSCCRGGLLRSMNVDTEKFDLVYLSKPGSGIYSLSQQQNDPNSVYLGEGPGTLCLFDGRVRKITSSWSLHKDRIKSIDFNPVDTNIMATASNDGLARLWDLRQMGAEHVESVALQSHNFIKALRSAYFSPCGSSLATTSNAGILRVIYGTNYEKKHMDYHPKDRCGPSSAAVWGWDDRHVYMGGRNGNVDVLSVTEGRVHILENSLVSAVPFQLYAHPFKCGTLAGGFRRGKAFILTASL